MKKQILISIIIPVYNGSKYLHRCLDALARSSYRSFEIIVVDDNSTDNSAEIGQQKGATVLHMPRRSGPAAARNYGAQKARGDILFFVDADVVVQQDTVARVAADFLKYPDIAAVFGSYDDDPAEKNFISQFKNLYHHFVHQQSPAEAVTFWAGCGAVRREIFYAAGGFDLVRYYNPSIEDVELGYRLHRAGHRILLDKDLQVKHLKLWNLRGLLLADIFYRAVPWSYLLIEHRHIINSLNFRISDRISTGFVGLTVALFPFSIYKPQALYAVVLLLAAILFLNRRLYLFFIKRRGLKFAALAFPMQALYYFYSGATFTLCLSSYVFLGKRSPGVGRKVEVYGQIN